MVSLILVAMLSGQAALPAAPVPYDALRGSRPVAPPPSSVDRPDMPSRGMGADAWTARVQGRFDAAQRRQGALDGAWEVRGADGATLYRLQMHDAPAGALEGAWRAVGGPAAGASGLIDEATRQDGGARLRLGIADGLPVTLVVTRAGEAFGGELSLGAQGPQPVTLARPTPEPG